jgi:O-antigen ligase
LNRGYEVKLEALKIDGRLTKWTALIILEMAIGVYCLVLPSRTAILLLVLVPLAIIMMSNYFFAYLLGIFLLPVWSITLTGQAEAAGQVDLRFSDACFIIAGLSWVANRITKRHVEIRGSYVDLWLVAFMCWVFLSILWSPSLAAGGKEFLRKLNGVFVFYLTINLVRNKRELDLTLLTWIISGGLAALVALYEVFTEILQRLTGISKRTIMRWGFLRATALKEGANRLGYFMNTCLIMTISQFFLQPRRKFRLFSVLLVVIMIFALMSTFSRNSILGFLVGTMILFHITKKGGKKFFVAGAVIAVLFFVLSGPAYRDVYIKRIAGLLEPQETRSVEGRTVVWEAAFRMIGENPFLGAGAGGFHVLSESYGARRLKSPHSLYVYLTAEYGIIGFLLFAGAAVAFWRYVKYGLKSSSDVRETCVLAALFATIAVYAFQGLIVNFVLIEREFWALLGLNVAAIRIYTEGESQ